MTRWFGDPWPTSRYRAPVCEDEADRVPTPVGQPCGCCNKLIRVGDQGLVIPCHGAATREITMVPYHLGCFLRMIGAPTS